MVFLEHSSSFFKYCTQSSCFRNCHRCNFSNSEWSDDSEPKKLMTQSNVSNLGKFSSETNARTHYSRVNNNTSM